MDLFLFPNAYIDVATIGSVATLTGGQIYRYSYFKVYCHAQWLNTNTSLNSILISLLVSYFKPIKITIIIEQNQLSHLLTSVISSSSKYYNYFFIL